MISIIIANNIYSIGQNSGLTWTIQRDETFFFIMKVEGPRKWTVHLKVDGLEPNKTVQDDSDNRR